MQRKKILIGISGSIAAYKIILLTRLLIKAGAEVKIVMTEDAKNFVPPLVLSTLSKNKVLCSFYEENVWNNHVELGRWADVFLIAPLSCNTLSKIASGQCDNLLLATYLSATCPVAVAPAMDEDMYKHPSTKKNIKLLKNYGVALIDVESGELASGLNGHGRMAEPETIFYFLLENYFRKNILKNKKVLVTAGPTYEAIDPVRFIGNHSSGKMGFAIANSFYEHGAEVILITGTTNEKINYKGIQTIKITSSDEMFNECIKYCGDADIIVMNAAVADFTPKIKANKKIKKTEEKINLELVATKDILLHLGKNKKNKQFIIGFALETDNEYQNALNKMNKKKLDCIILNSLKNAHACFGVDTNTISILDQKNELKYNNKPKTEVAEDIVHYTISKINLQN